MGFACDLQWVLLEETKGLKVLSQSQLYGKSVCATCDPISKEKKSKQIKQTDNNNKTKQNESERDKYIVYGLSD